MSNGKSASANVTFNVAGPSGTTVTTNIGSANVERVLKNSNGQITNIGGSQGNPGLVLYGITLSSTTLAISFKVGITLKATGTSFPSGNSGAYSWVQLIRNDSVQLRDVTGLQTVTPLPVSSSVGVLDTQYPFGDVVTSQNGVTNDTAFDAPEVDGAFLSTGEVARSFSAIMYLIWIPTADSACTAGTNCTIPVPLGSIEKTGAQTWSFSGDMINTLNSAQGQNTTTWILNCGPQPQTPSFQSSNPSTDPNQSYPVWDAVTGSLRQE